ncbi:MAG: hypothetical protein ACYSWZ_16240 [Planctomycetota bacterium]|jgi:hypothetical protein
MMRTKIKTLAFLTLIAVVILSVLGVAKYLDMQPKQIVSGITSLATQLQMHVQSQMKPTEHLSSSEKMFFPAAIFLLIILRTTMIKRITG